MTGTRLNYLWDIDKGIFNYVENDEVDGEGQKSDDGDTPPWEEKKGYKPRTDYKDATEVF